MSFRRAFFNTLGCCFVVLPCQLVLSAPGDQWNSGTQFHSPAAGSPEQSDANPTEGNAWDYGFRLARGYNDGKWSHMDATPFQAFRVSDEFGPSTAGAEESGPDLNRWWVPFPPPKGEVHVGRIIFAEGALESGGEKYLAKQVHLSTDDDAPTNGIVSLRWNAPEDGVYTIKIDLQNRLDVEPATQRDPFYNIVVNGTMLDEGLLSGFEAKTQHEYRGVTLKKGDTLEVCASAGSIAFPFALMAADVTIQQVEPSAAETAPAQLAAARQERDRGPEPILEIAKDHPYAGSMQKSAEWVKQNLGPDSVGPPISFTYNGKHMFRAPYVGSPLPADHLRGWKHERTWEEQKDGRLRKVITYRELKTNLELRIQVTEWTDFPVVEWVAYFKNHGDADTPLLEHIQPLNMMVDADRWVLHHNAGSFPGAASYAPFSSPLEPGRMLKLSAYGGRPSNTDMPYFNLEQDGDGMILAIGWPGQWETSFHRDQRRSLHVEAGQQLTHLRLQPGEEIRTPLVVLQFRKGGDWIDGQNVWRRWMLEHNQPRPGGKPLKPILIGNTGYLHDWMYKATEENQLEFIDRYLDRGIDLDYWWMDTGWYTPLWQPVPERFPRGIKPISDYAHSKGIKTILWFEPERVAPDNPIAADNPHWVLHASDTDQGLFNLGDEDARKWMTDHIHKVLADNDIDVFRSDFNMDPLEHWRQNDEPDRQGITENHFVTGYLAFWDGLLERMPHLLIDSCASGGRRNDLETMRRSVPLWKCDYSIEPIGMQCHTYGLAMWIPYFGNAGGQINKYVFRSNMYPSLKRGAWEDRTPTVDIRDDSHDYALLLKLIAEWRRISPNYFGDFYPLTPYSLEESAWMAWQFHTADSGEGFVQVFGRQKSPDKSREFYLRGLDPESKYKLEDLDTGSTTTSTGRELMEQGVRVEVTDLPAAKVFAYERIE